MFVNFEFILLCPTVNSASFPLHLVVEQFHLGNM
jgi:hypothetical protein